MTGDERSQLVRLGLALAEVMDRSGHASAGIVRQLVQAVAESPNGDDEASRCRCGAELPTGGAGRPARFCSTKCRQAAHRAARRNRDEMVS